MAKEIAQLKLNNKIVVEDIQVELAVNPTITDTFLIKYDNDTLKVIYKSKMNGFIFNGITIKKHQKLVWQRAQQQQ